jgi:outer membrane biosynthesis protein TonB
MSRKNKIARATRPNKETAMKITVGAIALAFGLLATSPLSHIQAEPYGIISDDDIKVLDFESLNYPSIALQTNYQGVVVVRVKLDPDGKVVEAAAISGHKLLIPDCLANVKKWRFQTNEQHTAVIVYNFRLSYAAKCKSAGSFFTLEKPNFATIIDCVRTIQ